jgi:hypothetical protein
MLSEDLKHLWPVEEDANPLSPICATGGGEQYSSLKPSPVLRKASTKSNKHLPALQARSATGECVQLWALLEGRLTHLSSKRKK